MERLCVVVYETSEDGKKALHNALAAYAIASNMEVIIKWLKPTAREKEITAACAETQIAFLSTEETEQAVWIGKLLYRTNPDCALIYYGRVVPRTVQESFAYFGRLFPARPILYLDRPTDQDYCRAIDTVSRYTASRKLFVWETRGMKIRVPCGSILYFRSGRNHVCIHMKDDTEYSYLGKIANAEQQLPRGMFVRVHQSYLINKSEVLLIDKSRKTVRMSNGEDIYISRSHYQETLEI